MHIQGTFLTNWDPLWCCVTNRHVKQTYWTYSKVRGYVCLPLKRPVFPAGLNCFNSKVFSFNILVSDELVFATGQQLFDPETQDGQFVSNPNVKHTVLAPGHSSES